MTDINVRTLQGDDIPISEAAIRRLGGSLRGALLLPDNPDYERARKIHNGMIDRRPALIARCAASTDVIAAVRFAAEHGLESSVRGGGHGVPGFAVSEGGFMIDLSPMKGIRVDPKAGTTRAESGVVWGELDLETQAFGLATTGGAARPTGIAGLTLAGGHGFLMRKHGLSCDNLLSAEIVTADGQMRIASATENADLFWGLRGGGGNFGVVTSFEYQLHPVSTMVGGLVIYPFQDAQNVLRAYHEFTAHAPDELGSLAILATLSDGTKAIVLLLGYNGPIDEGERILRPLRSLGSPIADTVAPITYTALQSIVEQFNPPGLRNYWKTAYLQNLDIDLINQLVDRYARVPSPHSHVVLYTLGGAVGRAAADTSAVAYREARHVLLFVGMWAKEEDDERNRTWVRDLWATAEPFGLGGYYVNYETEVAPNRIAAAYGAARFQRLASLKAKFDPTNLFRLNQNIPPAPNQ